MLIGAAYILTGAAGAAIALFLALCVIGLGAHALDWIARNLMSRRFREIAGKIIGWIFSIIVWSVLALIGGVAFFQIGKDIWTWFAG